MLTVSLLFICLQEVYYLVGDDRLNNLPHEVKLMGLWFTGIFFGPISWKGKTSAVFISSCAANTSSDWLETTRRWQEIYSETIMIVFGRKPSEPKSLLALSNHPAQGSLSLLIKFLNCLSDVMWRSHSSYDDGLFTPSLNAGFMAQRPRFSCCTTLGVVSSWRASFWMGCSIA